MNKLTQILVVVLAVYYIIVIILYFIQEKLIFFPTKLPASYTFSFENFEENSHQVENGITINSVLLTSKEKKGVVFFLHGNGGTIDGWAQGSSLYVNAGYDVLYLDYRGYGKSDGYIKSEKQLMDDAQVVYDFLKNRYAENQIIVSGTSIGTGIAAGLAASNNPRCLILHSPYYSLRLLIKQKVPFIPAFIIKYRLETYRYLLQVKCPVIIFHGDRDDIIPFKHSTDLKKRYPGIHLNIISGYGHNNLTQSEKYLFKMGEWLRQLY